jgi:S-layer homology domain
MRIKRIVRIAALATVSATRLIAQALPAPSLVATTTHRPDEFGTTGYTVTVIPATQFTSDTPPSTDYGSLFRNFSPPDAVGHFFSGVNVPAGAVIDVICVETSDDGQSTGYNYQANLYSVDRYSGTTSGILSLTANLYGGFGTTCNSTPLGFQWAQNAHNALVMDVYQLSEYCPFPQTCREHFGFGWVEIFWKRAVSPPPATPSFTDVSTTDSGYQYIEALAASGITGGCGGGNFCPAANLTRRQMAIFLAKALGLHWPG